MTTLLGDFIKQRNKTIIKDYKKLKKRGSRRF